MFAQPDLETVLDAHVKSFSTIEVYQGWQAEQLFQDATHVELAVRKGHNLPGTKMHIAAEHAGVNTISCNTGRA